jgi:NTP pyrophosphatase (non-canonical NTP hydrolase)
VALDIAHTQAQLRHFAAERDWEQFHSPKNLAMALTVEAAELLELFQWLTPEQSKQMGDELPTERVSEELADVLIYLIRLADVLGINLEAAVSQKIAANAEKYPVDEVRGSARKRGS